MESTEGNDEAVCSDYQTCDLSLYEFWSHWWWTHNVVDDCHLESNKERAPGFVSAITTTMFISTINNPCLSMPLITQSLSIPSPPCLSVPSPPCLSVPPPPPSPSNQPAPAPRPGARAHGVQASVRGTPASSSRAPAQTHGPSHHTPDSLNHRTTTTTVISLPYSMVSLPGGAHLWVEMRSEGRSVRVEG